MRKTKIQLPVWQILNLHSHTWVLIGFFISYFLFFIRPIFFWSDVMQFFQYVPAAEAIGNDLNGATILRALITNKTPYLPGVLFPPIESLFFAPLLLFEFSQGYKLFTILNIFCYTLMTFLFPLWVTKAKQVSPLLMLTFVTGLISYGFQFELERGHFNVIAVSLSFLAMWICHSHYRYRYLAYLLFTIDTVKDLSFDFYPDVY